MSAGELRQVLEHLPRVPLLERTYLPQKQNLCRRLGESAVSNLDSRLRLAACGEGLQTFFAPGSRVGSRRTVGVSCQTPKPWTVYVSAQIAYRGEVLVAARDHYVRVGDFAQVKITDATDYDLFGELSE